MSEPIALSTVREFAARCIERFGGAVEELGPDTLGAILPDSLAEASGGKSLVTLAFTPEALSQDNDAELTSIASPMMDALIASAGEVGVVSLGYLDPSNTRRKGLLDEVQKNLLYRNCRLRHDPSPPSVRDSITIVFNYRVNYISDDRRERLTSVAISMDTLQPNRIFAERLPRLLVQPDSTSTGLTMDADRVRRAYEQSKVELSRLTTDEGRHYQSGIQKRFEVEAARLTDYYMQSEHELTRRLEREPESRKRESLQSKITTTQLEKTRKIAELADKYRLRPRSSLTSIRLIRQPKTYFNIYVDRGPLTKCINLIYDSLLERLEPPICDHCQTEMTRITVTNAGLHLCPSCVG